jgi:CPA1 family monovalent cation:H+ antiporter
VNDLFGIEVLVLELLLIVSVVAVLVRRFRVPYTVALVVVGALLALRSRLEISAAPELILSLLLPPLVFEAAFHLNVDAVRRNLGSIVLFAIPGVLLNMAIVGGMVALGAGLPISLALVFGALIAATDPVSVVAIFRRLGVPRRLEVLLEGESLLNDGTAIVLFNLALAAALGGGFTLGGAVVDFVRVAAGGLLIGLALGWAVSRLIAVIDDHLVETTLTTVLAFGSYLIAEQLHVSGVLAVVVAGLVNGNLGPRGMSPTTRIVVLNFWEYVAFLANSAVFMLIGLQIDVEGLLGHGREILWAVAAVLVSRAVVAYGLSWLSGRMPSTWRHALYWGGLRGGVALALALSLPAALGEGRETLAVMAFGVVLFTLVGQGLTIGPLVRRLGLTRRVEEQVEYERRHARAMSARAAHSHLARLHRDGLLSTSTWERLEPALRERSRVLAEAVSEVLQDAPAIQAEELDTARREAMRASRSSLAGLRRDGVVSDEVYQELATEIDAALDAGPEGWFDMAGIRRSQDIHSLLAAVVQRRDAESATNALAERGIPVTRVQSSGGFLGLGSVTLLIGVPEGKLDIIVRALGDTCRTRVEYLPMPATEAGRLSLAPPTPVTIRGATVFVFDVERFEEF